MTQTPLTRAEKAKERKCRRRRAMGAVSRDEYTANSISTLLPWKALGISRATFYRKPQDERLAIIARMRVAAGGGK